MKQAASLHNVALPMLLPGITLSTGGEDFAPIKQFPIHEIRWDSLEAVRRIDIGVRRLTNGIAMKRVAAPPISVMNSAVSLPPPGSDRALAGA